MDFIKKASGSGGSSSTNNQQHAGGNQDYGDKGMCSPLLNEI